MLLMASAPRDGTLIRLRLRARTDLIGYYSDKWWGSVDYADPCPLIRGDNKFLGWEPVDQADYLNAPIMRKRRRKGPSKPVRIVG